MQEEILDDVFLLKKKPKPIFTFLNWVSIIILWIGLFICFINGILLNPEVISALILLAIASIVSYLKFDLGIKITLGIILMGVFQIISFFPVSFIYFFLGIIELELTLLVVGIIHIVINKKKLSAFLSRKISKEEAEDAQALKVKIFKKKFSKKSIQALELIANNNQFIPEAIIAAKELINEKNN